MTRRGALLQNPHGYSMPVEYFDYIEADIYVSVFVEMRGNEGGERFWCRVISKNDQTKTVRAEITQQDMLYANVHDFAHGEVIDIPFAAILQMRALSGEILATVQRKDTGSESVEC